MIAIKSMKNIPKSCSDLNGINVLKERASNCPLVEIVTCKDCKHREKVHHSYLSNKKDEVYFCTLQSDEYCYEVEDDHFCADAERRSDYGRVYR